LKLAGVQNPDVEFLFCYVIYLKAIFTVLKLIP